MPEMNPPDDTGASASVEQTLARLERRLALIEDYLGLTEARQTGTGSGAERGAAGPLDRALPGAGELEVAVGQSLFANVGIVVLAIGGALALSLPWHGVPRILPSAVGWVLAGALLALAGWLQSTVPQIGRLCRGAGMALLFYATFRLCYFGVPPLLAPQSAAAGTALLLVVLVNLGIGWWRKSAPLTGLAMATGYAAALAVGTPWYLLGIVTMLALVAVLALRVRDWPWLVVCATPCAFATYAVWAIGNPLAGNRLEVVAGPLSQVFFLLVWIVIHAMGMAWRRDRGTEAAVAQVGSLLNCGGYALFLVHTLARHGESFVAANACASLVLLGVAVMFWVREQSRFATFLYAMTGYAALNMALIKASAVPEVFVWLSAQSLLVVSTAIWFRSRIIIVTNFLIFLGVVVCYMLLVQKESGISLVFGVVALTSARILKWQKDRLELKTELMRNAYLTCAFIVFPYALYHMVPHSWVALSWVGIAVFYYVMNLLTGARKYRWLGHNTLLLTVVYILVMGIGKLEGTQRILSFLVLGSVLLVVSLVFTVIRARQHRGQAAGDEAGKGPADGGA